MDFLELKAQVAEQKPNSISIKLSQLEIVSLNEVKIKGKREVYLKLTATGLKGLIELLDLKQTSKNTISQMTTQEQYQFLSRIKTGFAKVNNKDILIIIDSDSNIRRIVPIRTNGFLLPEGALAISERILNKAGDIKITSAGGYSGEFKITYVDNKSYFGLADVDEQFQGGKCINYSFKDGLEYQEYAYRQVCSNGMMGFKYGNIAAINEPNSNTELSNFFQKIVNHNSFSFHERFKEQIQKHRTTVMSAGELKTLYQFLNKGFGVEQSAIIQKTLDIEPVVHMFNEEFPNLNKETAKVLRTPFNSWDIINKITHMGSHTEDYRLSELTGLTLNGIAGTIIDKVPDLITYNTTKQLF